MRDAGLKVVNKYLFEFSFFISFLGEVALLQKPKVGELLYYLPD
jgi:hypothetical protein